MTTYFISRHPGAIEWAARQHIQVDQRLAHLAPAILKAGDTVIGSLPVNLAAQVCAAGDTSKAYPEELLSIEAYTKGAVKPGDVMNADNIDLVQDLVDPILFQEVKQRFIVREGIR